MATTKNWTPNQKQVEFMDLLARAGKPISLKEIEVKYGVKYATGSINALITKGKVETTPVEFTYKVVETYDFDGFTYSNEKEKTTQLTLYSLVGYDYNEADGEDTGEDTGEADNFEFVE